MRLLLRAFPIFLLLGLCTASLAQSNTPSNPSGPQIDAVQAPPNNGGNNGNNAEDASLSTAPQTQPSGGGVTNTPLTQQQIDNINQTITLLQDQLQQINDPNDPRAIKLQETIERMQEILNNQ